MNRKKTLQTILKSKGIEIKHELLEYSVSKNIYIKWEELTQEMNEYIENMNIDESQKLNPSERRAIKAEGLNHLLRIGKIVIDIINVDKEAKRKYSDPIRVYSPLQKAVLEIAEETDIDLMPYVNVNMSPENMMDKLDELRVNRKMSESYS